MKLENMLSKKSQSQKTMYCVIAQLCEYTKNHWIVYFKWVNVLYVNYMSIELLFKILLCSYNSISKTKQPNQKMGRRPK